MDFRTYVNSLQQLDTARRTLGALLADVPYHRRRHDRRALENARSVARSYVLLLDAPKAPELDLEHAQVVGVARQLHRAAAEALADLAADCRPRPQSAPAMLEAAR